MSPAWIRPRKSKKGVRHQVLYRTGGRESTVNSAGTFPLLREAKDRRDLVGGWLAQGRDPKTELAKLHAPAAPVRDYAAWADAYLATRIDLSQASVANQTSHLNKLRKIFTGDPHGFTVAQQIEAVAELAKSLSAKSVGQYWITHRQLLTFAGVDPNPADDPAVKLPRVAHVEVTPPTGKQVLAILDHCSTRMRLPVVTIEQTGMAINEIETLAWGDVDVAGNRFRLQRSNVKGQIRARARWVQLPGWLMDAITATCPLEDRTATRSVFGVSGSGVRGAMARACKLAGIPVFSPHDLRHRRGSLWHGQGVLQRDLADRLGHTDATVSLNVYSHVMPIDELDPADLERLLA